MNRRHNYRTSKDNGSLKLLSASILHLTYADTWDCVRQSEVAIRSCKATGVGSFKRFEGNPSLRPYVAAAVMYPSQYLDLSWAASNPARNKRSGSRHRVHFPEIETRTLTCP